MLRPPLEAVARHPAQRGGARPDPKRDCEHGLRQGHQGEIGTCRPRHAASPVSRRPAQRRAGRLDARGHREPRPASFSDGYCIRRPPDRSRSLCPRARRRTLPYIHDQERGMDVRRCRVASRRVGPDIPVPILIIWTYRTSEILSPTRAPQASPSFALSPSAASARSAPKARRSP